MKALPRFFHRNRSLRIPPGITNWPVMDQVTSERKCETMAKLTQRAAAWALNRTYQHLSAIIKGKRQSASLSARYSDLLERHAAGRL
jgi:hypothetical protein